MRVHNSAQPTFYSNRALALLKLGRFAESLRDCNAAIKADANFVKAYYYKADSLLKLGEGGAWLTHESIH